MGSRVGMRERVATRTNLSCETKDVATVCMAQPERVSIENSNGS